VRDLIGNTFSKQLNSSESAFDLLSKFQNVRTRETIKKLLKEKYDDVLRQYDKELTKNEILFEEGRENPPISKNMPMQAGRIAWARSIMGRIKAPIKKFKTKSDQLFGVGPIFKDVATKYVKLAKELDKNYEQKIFKNWQEVNTNKAIEHLQQHILKRKKTADYNVYTVNFAPELKVTIREAKFLSRIGKPIPQTIINIALQEKDYMRHVDKLNQLLRNYTQAVSDLRPVERRLLRNDIEKLDKHMDKGYANHNWFSLSIDEYIKECRTAIDTFKETKNNVKGHSNNIDKQVNKIENSQIIKQIDFERAQPMDISEFTEYFESHRQLMISDLVKDYQFIGDNYLKSIEECTVKNTSNDSGKSEAMKPYYAYWERRIFNAITKMIVRALAANFTLYKRNEKPFLIRMTSSYNPPDIQFHPTCDELKSALDKFNRNILDSAKQFGRWWDGFARIFEEKTNEETGEKSIPFTFHDDIKTNKMIVQMSFDIIQQQTQIMDKFGMISGHYTNKKGPMYRLFDKQEMTKMQKLIEKNQSTKEIERRILTIKGLLDQQMKKDQEQNNYIVLIDNSDLHHKTIDKIKEWLEILGDSLKNIASKQLKQIVEQTSKYNKEL
jgi:dynein heavy chain